MDIFFKILSIFFSLTILANAYVIKRYIGTWLFPGCIFSLFWFAYTFAPLVILFEIPINPLSVLFIAICVILFSWTFIFFDWKKAFKLNKKKQKASIIYDTTFLRRILYFSIVISIFSTFKQVIAQDNITLHEIFTDPLIVSGKYMTKRYSHTLNYTIFFITSLVFSYISVLVGGLIFGSSLNKKIKRNTILSFLPPLSILLTQGAKGLLFLSVFLFLGSVLITKYHNKKFELFTSNNIKKIIKTSSFLILALIISFMSRGLQNVENTQVLIGKIRKLFASYALTHLYAFSDWFTSYTGGVTTLNYDVQNNYFGYYTFTALAKYYGPNKKAIPGVYGEYYTYSDIIKSNIYTIYRGLIMDFTITGTLIFFVLNGFLLHYSFYIFVKSKKPIVSSAIIIFMVGYFYITYIISLLTWNITILSFLLLIFILFINNNKFVLKKKNFE